MKFYTTGPSLVGILGFFGGGYIAKLVEQTKKTPGDIMPNHYPRRKSNRTSISQALYTPCDLCPNPFTLNQV